MFGNKLQNKAYVAPAKKKINRPPCNQPTKQEIKLNNLIDDLEKSKKKDMKTSGKLSPETKQKEIELMKKLENEKPEWIEYEEVKPFQHNEPPKLDFDFIPNDEAYAIQEMRKQIEHLFDAIGNIERTFTPLKKMEKYVSKIDEFKNGIEANNSMMQSDIQNLRNRIDEIINRPNPYENNLKSLEEKIEEIMKKPDNTEQIRGKIKKLKTKIQLHRTWLNDFSGNFKTMTEQFIDFEDVIKHIIEQASKTNIEELKDLNILTMPFYTRKFRYTVLDTGEAKVETMNKEQQEKIMSMLNGLKETIAGMTLKKDEKKDDWDDE